MKKADACRWNLSKKSFMEYAAKKIKILQPLQPEQENIISLLVGGTNGLIISLLKILLRQSTLKQSTSSWKEYVN